MRNIIFCDEILKIFRFSLQRNSIVDLWSFAIRYSQYTATSSNGQMVSWSKTWWRHQMERFSALLAFCVGNLPVTNEFPKHRPVTRSWCFLWSAPKPTVDKQWGRRWFETPSRSLWRHQWFRSLQWEFLLVVFRNKLPCWLVKLTDLCLCIIVSYVCCVATADVYVKMIKEHSLC